MSKAWDALREFRGSRSANILASVIWITAGLYGVVVLSDPGSFALGVLFLIIGLLTLYNQLLGEPVTETLKKRFDS